MQTCKKGHHKKNNKIDHKNYKVNLKLIKQNKPQHRVGLSWCEFQELLEGDDPALGEVVGYGVKARFSFSWSNRVLSRMRDNGICLVLRISRHLSRETDK